MKSRIMLILIVLAIWPQAMIARSEKHAIPPTSLSDAERATALIDAARVQIFLKGTDSHDYKFSSAVLEDYGHVSPNWRNTYLATSVFKLRGTGGKDNGLVERARAALA